MTPGYLLPLDVPISDTYADPDDSQRRWALGWSATAGKLFFLASWRDDAEWRVAEAVVPTPERVALWSTMLAETETPLNRRGA